MVKRLIFLLILMLGIGIGIGLISTTSSKNNPEKSQSVVANNGFTNKADIIKNQEISLIPNTSEKTVDSLSDDLQEIVINKTSAAPIDVIRNLNTKSIADLSPGWIHLREEAHYDTDEGNNGVLPNGAVIPLHQINDTWYHLNEELLVFESISIMQTMDGEIVQVGVVKNGVGWNSATGETEVSEPEKLNGFDFNFLNDLVRMQDFGIEPQVNRVTLSDGREGIQIVIVEKFEAPIKSVDYEKLNTKAETRALFDEETGYLLQKTVVIGFDDGSERVFLEMSQTVIEETPPDDILQLLNNTGGLEVEK